MSEGQDWDWGSLTLRSHVGRESRAGGGAPVHLYIEVHVWRGLGLGWGVPVW